jgi:ribonuclease HII
MGLRGVYDQIPLFPTALHVISPSALDDLLRGRGFSLLAGVDEAGRGPLAGPVVAAAVIFPGGSALRGLTDSKVLSPERREDLFPRIHEAAIAVGVGLVEADEIDRVNILRATRRAMEDAVSKLLPPPHALVIDGPQGIAQPIVQFPLVKGDARSHSVAAASVVAKVTRDRIMAEYHLHFPEYGFDRHKGYGTKEHLKALRRYGSCVIHRKTFRGVLNALP